MKRFHALDKDGMARVGEQLYENDVYINKYTPKDVSMKVSGTTGVGRGILQVDSKNVEMKPDPVYFRGLANSVYVDRMILTSNFEENCLIKMITR